MKERDGARDGGRIAVGALGMEVESGTLLILRGLRSRDFGERFLTDASESCFAIARVGARAAWESCDAAFMPLTIHAPALSSGPSSSNSVRVLISASSLRISKVPHRPYSAGTGLAASHSALTWRYRSSCARGGVGLPSDPDPMAAMVYHYASVM